MPIMKWGTPPSGTHDDRRAHVVGHGDNVSLQHAAFGDHVEGAAAQITDINKDYGRAIKWSTAPYKGDDEPRPGPKTTPYRDSRRMGKCMANDDTCNGNATHASGLKWCAGHAKAMAKQEK